MAERFVVWKRRNPQKWINKEATGVEVKLAFGVGGGRCDWLS